MSVLGYWREGNNDEKGPIEPFVLHQVGNECNGLDGFAKAHFISQDAIEIVVVQGYHPLKTLGLQNRKTWKEMC